MLHTIMVYHRFFRVNKKIFSIHFMTHTCVLTYATIQITT